MDRRFLFILFIVFPLVAIAQEDGKIITKDKKLFTPEGRMVNDTTRTSDKSTSNDKIKNLDAKIEDYKIISYKNDTTYVDTTLTIHKDYKYNYLRKDNFNLLQFSNIGQTYNTLSKDFSSSKLMPEFAAQSKHFNYMEIEDINYYYVPTPLTELMYKTAFEQGQLLDAFFTVNTSKQFNFSLAYKGLRSLGKYQNILTSTGNFRFTSNYKTKNERYQARAHVVMQDILNEENGGIKDEDIPFFESGDPEYLDRSIFDVNFENAEGILKGKRFFLQHSYALVNQKDSIAENVLKLHNIVSLEDKYYDYSQDTAETDYFGEAFSSNIYNKVKLESFYSRIGASYKNNFIGDVGFALNYNNYNYGYDQIVQVENDLITNRLKGDVLGFDASYSKKISKFKINGELGANFSGDFTGNYLLASLEFDYNDANKVILQINSNAKEPNYNFQLFQSDYINYNWNTNFNTIKTNQLSANILSDNLLNLKVDFTTIDGYTYFKNSETDLEAVKRIKPFQNNNTISYLRVKIDKEFRLGKFALNNTIMYQEVSDDEQSFNVPKLMTRNTLYYSNHFFKKALFLQTGVTLNYFTEYYMNAYDPVLSEFYVQNERKYGNFPRLDFFVNAKVRQTRIFLKAEHFNSSWTGYNYYSAPNYPYRDFIVRFGLVWNFFL